MTTVNPLVSILVAAHDAAPWLESTLRSALAQTWEHIEVIVIDDGSTDDTARIAEGIDDHRLRVFSQPNRGACAARNRALAEARGDYVQYLDADDLLTPDKIREQLTRLAGEPEGTIASGPWLRFHGEPPAGQPGDRSFPDWRAYEPASDWLIQAWQGRGTMPLFAWLIPRAIIDATGPWSEDLLRNQDGEYMARVLVRARRIAFCPGAWGFYRSGLPGSVSRREEESALRSLFRASELCEATLLGHDDRPEARRACAGLWQHFLFTAYPDVPDLVTRAEARVGQLGGMYLRPGVIKPLRPVRDLIGWKAAVRLQRLYGASSLRKLVRRMTA